MNKIYFIYKTTNIKTNKFYIGVHETTNLEDGYLGSGKRLKLAIKYHGRQYFTREILEFFNTRETMYNKERQMVNEELLRDPKCMNLTIGGSGGFALQHSLKGRVAAKAAYAVKLKNDPVFRKKVSDRIRATRLNTLAAGNLKSIKESYNWTGKKHTDETKSKQSATKKGKGKGISNSQYGSKWITDGTNNKKIKANTLPPSGWVFGRNIAV